MNPGRTEQTGKESKPANQEAGLDRKFGLLSATALNMSNMMGAGPFLTIPLLISEMGGPQAMLGWLIAILITIPDGMIWSELGAAMPGSGGSYVYLREGFGPARWGRLMSFLFIWQFILSGPLEIATGYLGFAQYLHYLTPHLTARDEKLICIGLGVVVIGLLYRRIQSVAWITLCLWVGTLITVLVVIVTGIVHFDASKAFDFPPNAWDMNGAFWKGLGGAALIGIYDYLGYYDICFLGSEVKNPGRVIPRSVMISLVCVALIYIAINLSIMGTISWREFVPADEKPAVAKAVVSVMMERIYGPQVAGVVTLLILWTTVASIFALLLGYSRVPYAAALDGGFFSWFKGVHPTEHFPHRSLLVLGAVSIVCSFWDLSQVITVLVTLRILVVFVGQIVAVMWLRRLKPDMERPYRIWFYPVPCLVAFAGWMYVFLSAELKVIALALGVMIVGVVVYGLWQRHVRSAQPPNPSWPTG